MAAAEPGAPMAILGYWYAHLAMICGGAARRRREAALAGEMTHGAPWCSPPRRSPAGAPSSAPFWGWPLALRWLGAVVAPAFGIAGAVWGAVAGWGLAARL